MSERYTWEQIYRRRGIVQREEAEMKRLARRAVEKNTAEAFDAAQRAKASVEENRRLLARMERSSMFFVHDPEGTVHKYAIPEDSAVTIAIQSPEGQQLGIQFNPNGTFTLGGWDEEGEWHEIVPKISCPRPECITAGHTASFELDRYTKAGEPQGALF